MDLRVTAPRNEVMTVHFLNYVLLKTLCLLARYMNGTCMYLSPACRQLNEIHV